jgi:hypothetical protein
MPAEAGIQPNGGNGRHRQAEIPAQAGISKPCKAAEYWIPPFAG